MRTRAITVAVLVATLATQGCRDKREAAIPSATKAPVAEGAGPKGGGSKVKVSGSVFVVTKGGQNYKLALVPVTAVPKEAYEAEKSRFVADLRTRVTKRIAESKALKEQALVLRRDLEQRVGNYRELMTELRFAESDARRTSSIRLGLDGKISLLGSKQSVHRDGSSMIAGRLIQLSTELAERWEAIGPFHELYRGVHKRWLELSKEIVDMVDGAHQAFADQMRSKYGTSATTDADGAFAFAVKAETRALVLTGTGSRYVGDEKEEFVWEKAVSLGEDETRVLLSNHDLVKLIDGLESVIGSVDFKMDDSFAAGLGAPTVYKLVGR